MAQKTVTSLGIDHDIVSIRGAKVLAVGAGKGMQYRVEGLHEIKGDFAKEEGLAKGLQELRTKLGVGAGDRAVSCVAGKQVYVTQMPFKRMPHAEMVSALRIEMRKSLPFDAAGATIDYQEADDAGGAQDDRVRLIVTAVASNALNKHLRTMGKAGLKPWIVDVLPLAVANAFWSVQRDPTDLTAHVLIHFQADMCTVVIDGNMVPYYTRTVYFTADELYGQGGKEVAERERTRRLMALGDELHRSLAFYEKTFQTSSFAAVHLFGNYFGSPELMEVVNQKVGLRVAASPLLERLGVKAEGIPPGKFDVALGLAMRGAVG